MLPRCNGVGIENADIFLSGSLFTTTLEVSQSSIIAVREVELVDNGRQVRRGCRSGTTTPLGRACGSEVARGSKVTCPKIFRSNESSLLGRFLASDASCGVPAESVERPRVSSVVGPDESCNSARAFLGVLRSSRGKPADPVTCACDLISNPPDLS